VVRRLAGSVGDSEPGDRYRHRMLEMREVCERCETALDPGAEARICSYECTFCPSCSDEMAASCPNCGGELVARPRRAV
jgi:hypothetical protein